MEIYRNSADRELFIDVPVQANNDSVDVTIYRDGEEVFSAVTVLYADGRYSTQIPFSILQNEGTYSVNWYFIYTENGQAHEFNEYQEFNVVTPVLPLSQVKQIIESDDDALARTVEQAVRHIIQAHTGQSFGRYVGSKSVTGSGENSLRLPSRVISLKSINGSVYAVHGVAVRGNGWYLQSKSRDVPTIRADWDGWNEATAYTSGVPIAAPNHKSLMAFHRHQEYLIDGVWGWNSVPAAVSEAAKLLINDYACADSNYRDRFLTSMTAADWRIQFHDGAFTNTGNVRANQLLSAYVLKRGWTVL
jgi:hypothetical protein